MKPSAGFILRLKFLYSEAHFLVSYVSLGHLAGYLFD